MKIIVIGSNGQLGSDLVEVLSTQHDVIGLTHSELEIKEFERMKEIFNTLKADIVINTAAAHNVPKCEADPVEAFLINGMGVLNLAKLSNDLKFILVHYSTDYVFNGLKNAPYIESDSTNPLNVYGITKLTGENFLSNYADRAYILRISGIYGKIPSRAKGGSNFVTTMIKLSQEKTEVKVVDDEILTPTSTLDIATNTKILVEQNPNYGVYHMTNEGECSWYEFAEEIFTTLNLKTPLVKTSVTEMPQLVKRPYYSVLENKELKSVGLNKMPYWRDSLQFFLRDYKK